ncbi:pseudouridine synthase [Treponema sp. UBA3813]|uniref:pseudouridine synthase n=1 Tax=Treponema sp. UBA3813 TaxID=1947715 RepID=UPI0025FD0271|nr:pseudouridine synthase [Treponema sp. UBA3813]
MNVIHEPSASSPFLVISKPAGIPSAPLFEGDESLLTQAIRLFPEIKNVCGKKSVEHGLIHRIDTETSGLLLIATSQESYDALLKAQKDDKFEKFYRAEIEKIPDCAGILGGFPPLPDAFSGTETKISAESSFRTFGKGGKEVRPVTQEAGRAALKKGGNRLYKTEIVFESEKTALCHITAGFRHQVRCHLAWCGFPVHGDKIYNPKARNLSSENHDMKFCACKIIFPHPLTGLPQVFET